MLVLEPKDVSREALIRLLFTDPVDEFEIKTVDSWKLVIDDETVYLPTLLEELIEANDHSCRIYTQARAASLMSVSIPVIGPVTALGSALGMAVHNLATYNPDFEIRKGLRDRVRVTNHKKIKRDEIADKQSQ